MWIGDELVLHADADGLSGQKHVHEAVSRDIEEHCVACHSALDWDSFARRMRRIHLSDLHGEGISIRLEGHAGILRGVANLLRGGS